MVLASLAAVEPFRVRVIRDSLGVGIATGAYGVAFGAASVAAGLSIWQTMVLSLLTFTGGTQFAVVGVVASGGSMPAALGGGLLLGARNALYAMRMAPILRPTGWRRLVAAHGTIDETTALATAQPNERLAGTAFWWTFGAVWTFWNLATYAGAAGAEALGDPNRFGLDAVVPAAFMALLAPRLRGDRAAQRVAAGAVVIAVALVSFVPPGVPVLAATATLLLAGRLAPPQAVAEQSNDNSAEGDHKGGDSR